MELTPLEKDKLLIFTAALLADRRMSRGVKLNYPGAVAYLGRDPRRGARRAKAAMGTPTPHPRDGAVLRRCCAWDRQR